MELEAVYDKAIIELPRGGEAVRLGRLELCFAHPRKESSVSRHHARIRFDAQLQCCWVEDLGSRNGVFINDSRIPANRDTKLVVGDHIRFGSFEEFAYTLRRPKPARAGVVRRTGLEEDGCAALIFSPASTAATTPAALVLLSSELQEVKLENERLKQALAREQHHRKELELKAERSGEFVRVLRETLECPVCFEVKRDLMVLRCGHSLCQSCFKKWEATSALGGACIVCSKKVKFKEAASSFVLNQVMDQIDGHCDGTLPATTSTAITNPMTKRQKLPVNLCL
ncbi:hypothetical protein BASA81_001021 [Batrachochytrium salamandrivorans]|nr:hypothetical protein BASA81_001021 [Batrachochytrium salamandrivorans]